MSSVSSASDTDQENKAISKDGDIHHSNDDDDTGSDSQEDENEGQDHQVEPSQQKPLQLSKESLERFQERERKKGIIYLSRIPPYMKPQKVRHLLEMYGKIDRIYLAPEDNATRRRRFKSGGNKKIKYTEGWVEFLDKKVAKRVALSLNNTPIGQSGRKFFDSDLWNMRYLKGFKWSYLTEKLNCERQIQAQRLRAEMSQAKRENEFYKSKVDQAERLEKIAAKSENEQSANQNESNHSKTQAATKSFKPRHFPQKHAREESTNSSSSTLNSELLRKIAGGGGKKRKRD